MSVSYVVPVWREEVFDRTSRPWIEYQVERFGAELIEVRGQRSIFEALEVGRQAARHRFIAYVHDDVKLCGPIDLTQRVALTFERFPKLGLMGPVGKIDRERCPWWLNKGPHVGHWCRRGDANQLVYQFAKGAHAPARDVRGDPYRDLQRRGGWDQFALAGLVDGFYLIEDSMRLGVPWDIETFGPQWHAYDIDRCMQAHQLGLEVMVSPWLFLHDNAGHAGYKDSDPTKINGVDQANRRINSEGDRLWLADLEPANQLLRSKWGLK